MTKIRILLGAIIIIVVALLYMLPKVVVEGDEEQSVGGDEAVSEEIVTDQEVDGSGAKPSENASSHMQNMPAKVKDKIKRLRKSLLSSDNEENTIIFADSLAVLFTEYNKYDSAAKYTEISSKDAEVIGDAYYDAFSFAVDANKARKLAESVRRYYEQVLQEDASRLDLKTRIAMTYVSSENPMQGIMMLREVIEQDPTNEEALFNLGVLSIQSGQYDKAIKRFETLLEEYPQNEQAMFYLGMSHYNSGDVNKAKEMFMKVKEISNDEQLLGVVESYLSEL